MAHLSRLIAWAVLALVACVVMLLPLKAQAFGVVPQESGQPPLATYCRGNEGFGGASCTTFEAQRAFFQAQMTAGRSGCSFTVTWSGFTPPGTNRNSYAQAAGENVSYTCTQPSTFSSSSQWRVNGVCAPGFLLRQAADWTAPYTCTGPLVPSCPTDATLTGGQCVCNSGFKPGPLGSGCVAINCQAALDTLRGKFFEWNGNTSTVCLAGCRMTATVRGFNTATGRSSAEGSALSTDSDSCQGANAGANANGNDAGAGEAAQRCPTGQCPGTVNGASVCVPCNTTQQGPKVETSAPSASSPAPLIPGAPEGSTQQESRTDCDGSTCTTVTTWRNPAGAVTGEKTETEPQQSWCTENPQSPVCKSGAWSGSCSSAFACEGDPIQCAMAREQHQRNCSLFEAESAQSEAGAEAVAKGDLTEADRVGLAPGLGGSVDFSTRLDQTNRLGAGCPTDVTLAVMGQPLVIGFSALCGPLGWLGNVAVGLSLLAAAFIVFKRGS